MKKITLLFALITLVSCEEIPSSIGGIIQDYLSSINNISSSINESTSNELEMNSSDTNLDDSSSLIYSIPDEEKISIYINPSVQTANMYYNNITTEAETMNKLAKILVNELNKDPRFLIYHNLSMMSLKESIKHSNSLNVDYHLALHTNAGGGSGSEAYFYKNNKFAKELLSTFDKYHNFPKRGVKNGSHLYELKNATAKNSCLIEFLFHDNQKEANYIINNLNTFASSIIETFDKIASK